MAIVEIPLQPLSPDAFAPFGTVIGRPARPPELALPRIESWSMPFEADAPLELMFNRFYYRPLQFRRLERHFHVTQGFLPLSRVPFVMVVAAPTPPGTLPDPDDIHAFHCDGREGLLLGKSVWHAVGRFPIATSYIDFGFLTDQATQRELEEAKATGAALRRTEIVDFGALDGVEFVIIDRNGALPKP